MTKVAVMVLADPTESPRPRRVIKHLRETGREVVTAGTANADCLLPQIRLTSRFAKRAAMFLLGMYEKIAKEFVYDEAEDWLVGENPDVVIVHDIKLLPWLHKLNGDWKIVVDLQEYYPHMLNELRFKLSMGAMYKYIINKYLPHVDECWTVSEYLQLLYYSKHNIGTSIVPNAPQYVDLPVVENTGQIRMVHHGYALHDRNIEAMVEAVDSLNGLTSLDLVLLKEHAWPEYYEQLKELIRNSKHCQFVEPGPIDQIVKSKNEYDIGLYVLPPDSENMRGAMPNKFYDFVQARLAIICGPDGEMSRVVKETGVGFLTTGYSSEDIAKKIVQVFRPDIDGAKRKSDELAYPFSFEGSCVPRIEATMTRMEK